MVNADCDIIAEIKFYLEKDGGRKGATPDKFFGCPTVINDNYYDSRLLLADIGPIKPGDKVIVPVKFLDPQTVLKFLKEGDGFKLWETGNIAAGKVIRVCSNI